MRAIAVLLLGCLLSGCQLASSTRLEVVAAQPGRQEAAGRLLVVGPTTNPELQSVIEKTFARRLQRRHDLSLASISLPGGRQPLSDQVMARLKGEGITHVLSVQLLHIETSRREEKSAGFSLFTPERVPGARVGWQQESWEAGAQAQLSAGGAAVLIRKALLDVQLYDVATSRSVWQARAHTLLRGEDGEEFEDFASTAVRALRKDGWL